MKNFENQVESMGSERSGLERRGEERKGFIDNQMTKTMKYTFNKWIFRSVIISVVILAIAAWALENFTNPFDFNVKLSCPKDGPPCRNPFFHGCTIENCPINKEYSNRIDYDGSIDELEFLPPGFTYGSQPNWILRNYTPLVLVLVLAAFTLNHFVHNKKFGLFGKLKQAIKDVRMEEQDERV